jgi:NADH-quinone oxidoreductase subunit N
MYSFGKALFPELDLAIAASILFLMGTSRKGAVRRLCPVLAAVALAIAFVSQLGQVFNAFGVSDPWQSIQITQLARYIKLLAAAIGFLLVLLAWPSNEDGTEGPAIHFGQESGEFFGLLLLSITGLFLVAGANDFMLLFLGIELASLPTYIMVSISRPLPVAQEAGVKYFFLGALAAAVMLLGFTYLYGTTGTITLQGGADSSGNVLVGVDTVVRGTVGGVTPWQMLAVVFVVVGLAFKMLAVPMQVYAADVYQGAATPVTAFLSFVPKASGFVALLKVLYAVGGDSWSLPPEVAHLIWWIALLTMTVGNVLGLLQENIKRLLAYSSIAHSGYMLVGVAALLTATGEYYQQLALRGVLFYLLAYGLTNVAAFGVLILLPGSDERPGTSSETFAELAGVGRRHVALGLAMSVACFSLIGIPLTVGFAGKVMLIQPALQSGLVGLVVFLVINSAISAAYYLRIVATMFLRPLPATPARTVTWPMPVLVSIALSVIGVLLLGAVIPITNRMALRAQAAGQLQFSPATAPAAPASVFTSASAAR